MLSYDPCNVKPPDPLPLHPSQGFQTPFLGSTSFKSHAVSQLSLQCCQVSGYSDKTWIRGKATRVNPEQIAQSVDDSLKRLQTDHLDLLQIHWPDRYLPLFGSGVYDPKQEREDDVSFEEQLKGLERVIKAGKVSRTQKLLPLPLPHPFHPSLATGMRPPFPPIPCYRHAPPLFHTSLAAGMPPPFPSIALLQALPPPFPIHPLLHACPLPPFPSIPCYRHARLAPSLHAHSDSCCLCTL